MNKQVHVLYTGRVQGVGFRFTVEEIAEQLGVKGWVRNLRNGQVELLGQAQEGILDDFLSRIKETFAGHIQSADINWDEATQSFDGFEILS
jgi:acylphosphatase